jgi:hypothetical protein
MQEIPLRVKRVASAGSSRNGMWEAHRNDLIPFLCKSYMIVSHILRVGPRYALRVI